MDPAESSPVIFGQTGPLQGRRWIIPKEGLVLGREEGCDIVIPDRQVSRRHAQLHRKGEKVFLQDLESKNGTCINGNTVQDTLELKDGDIVQIALAAEFMFVSSDSTLPLDFEGAPPRPGRIRLNPKDHSVFIGEQEINPPLSIYQYRLLELLILRAGALITREDLVNAVWPEEESGGISDQAIDALVRRLRERLKEVDPDRDYLLTVRGHGFRLDTTA